MVFVAGLGNPGQRYADTRHNVGFMVIERLAQRWHISLGDDVGGARTGVGRISEQPVTLVEPQRYMNLSGEVVAPLRADGAALIVVHDDVDVPCGQLRVKRGGGDGGHRGVASIALCCGAEFDRVRVGVGRPSDGHDTSAHVLAPFGADEQEVIGTAIERAADAVEALLSEGLDAVMNRFNQRVPVAAPAK
ncbi:MAG: aminoacyl-tRNA hydrolase [Deltaproteobacteria bacterium]|nr:aminoacyl-tRNA hydrolase [Deltaproteobacteria bacterium]MBI3391263.1 aminoacyl-tRNA hydrolase [Deltaproteobacteria bacterium]